MTMVRSGSGYGKSHVLSLLPEDTHSRGYGYDRGPYPPPPYGTGRRGPPDPHTFDYPATLKQYAEWFRYYYPQQAMEEDNADKAAEVEAGDGSKPRNGIRSRWEKYKKEFAAQQVCHSCACNLPPPSPLLTVHPPHSFSACSIIIGSRRGSRRSTTQHPSSRTCARV